MIKFAVAAFFCAFVNLFAGAAEAVPVPAFVPGKHVYIQATLPGYRLSPALSAGLSQLETQLAGLHYPTYFVLFAPGYRTEDMAGVTQQLLSAWMRAGYKSQTAITEVAMLAPVWVELSFPVEFQPDKNYLALLRDTGLNFSKVFGLFEEIDQARLLADKEVQQQRAKDLALALSQAEEDLAWVEGEAERIAKDARLFEVAAADLDYQAFRLGELREGVKTLFPNLLEGLDQDLRIAKEAKSGQVVDILELSLKLSKQASGLQVKLARKDCHDRTARELFCVLLLVLVAMWQFSYRLKNEARPRLRQLEGVLRVLSGLKTAFPKQTEIFQYQHFGGKTKESFSRISTQGRGLWEKLELAENELQQKLSAGHVSSDEVIHHAIAVCSLGHEVNNFVAAWREFVSRANSGMTVDVSKLNTWQAEIFLLSEDVVFRALVLSEIQHLTETIESDLFNLMVDPHHRFEEFGRAQKRYDHLRSQFSTLLTRLDALSKLRGVPFVRGFFLRVVNIEDETLSTILALLERELRQARATRP